MIGNTAWEREGRANSAGSERSWPAPFHKIMDRVILIPGISEYRQEGPEMQSQVSYSNDHIHTRLP